MFVLAARRPIFDLLQRAQCAALGAATAARTAGGSVRSVRVIGGSNTLKNATGTGSLAEVQSGTTLAAALLVQPQATQHEQFRR